MTVICAQLGLAKTIHATDSLLTRRKSRRRAKGSGEAKFIAYPPFRGAISWFGQISSGHTWTAQIWLTERLALLQSAPVPDVDEFTADLADELTFRLRKSHIQDGDGLGLHFTCYDVVENEIIPELFLITNFNGLEYRGGPKFVAQRQSFHWLSGNLDTDFQRHKDRTYRFAVRDHLTRQPIIFSNGQPTCFSQHVPAIQQHLAEHSIDDVSFWDAHPIELCKSITREVRRRSRKSPVAFPCYELHISPGMPGTVIYQSREHTSD